jgi:cell division protein FtsQ
VTEQIPLRLEPPQSDRRGVPDRRRRLKSAPPVIPAEVSGGEAPFLRSERRRMVRRQRRGLMGRAVLALQLGGVLLVMVIVVWAGYARVMASERLRVAKVDVRGGQFLSEGEVRELLGPAVGENILNLDIADLKARLRSSPWVQDATVARTLPDTLRVEIRERVPLALAEVDRLYLMDGDGALIDIYGPRTASFDLPIVRGLLGVDAEERRYRAERAGALLRDLGDLAAEISEVEVEPSGDLRVVLRGESEVLRLGAPPYRSRMLVFLGLRHELRARCPEAEYFDLRFKDRIYAKEPPRKIAAIPETTLPGTPLAPAPAPAAGAVPEVSTESPAPSPVAEGR